MANNRNFHAVLADGSDLLSGDGLEGGNSDPTARRTGLAGLDRSIGKFNRNSFAISHGPLTQNGDTVYYPAMDVFFHRETDGKIVKNTIAAGSILLDATTVSSKAAWVTLNETDSTPISVSASASAVDMDALPGTLNDGQVMVLFMRPLQASGRAPIHYVGLHPSAPLHGIASPTTAAVTTVVTLTGFTMPSTDYHVVLSPGVQTALLHPYVKDADRTTSQFTITHQSATTNDKIFWMIVG